MYLRRVLSLGRLVWLYHFLVPGSIRLVVLRLRGARIGKGVKLRFGAVIAVRKARNCQIGAGTLFLPFTFVKADSMQIGSAARFYPGAVIDTRSIKIGDRATFMDHCFVGGAIRPGARLMIGDDVKIFPSVGIDCGWGVEIGDRTGIGGHCQLFTHGSWLPYVDGWPVKFGSIEIGCDVWLNWNVLVTPDVQVETGAVVASGSVITKHVKTNTFVAGVPAKAVTSNIRAERETADRRSRIADIVELFKMDEPDKAKSVKFLSSWDEASDAQFNVADLPAPPGGPAVANWFSFSDSVGRHSDPKFWRAWSKVLGYFAVRARTPARTADSGALFDE